MKKIATFVILAILIAVAIGSVTKLLNNQVQGKVLAGQKLQNQIVVNQQISWKTSDPLEPHYPESPTTEPPTWQNLDSVAPQKIVYATNADARFNDEDAKYRIAFHLSHYGGMPDSAGDFNGDGVEDFINMSHFAYVDGMHYAGEVHVYFGKKNALINPQQQVPDIIFYGDEAGAKLGISVASAGDINGDGKNDLMMSAAFHSMILENGKKLENAGIVYVIYGGSIELSNLPAKVRIQDIGTKLPGMVFQGGHDGRLNTAWANGLEAGDFNGDGISDIIIGAYNPYDRKTQEPEDFNARAYLIYGSKNLPIKIADYRLGVDRDRQGIKSMIFDVPDRSWTRESLGFGAFFVKDINRDGLDELAFATGSGGSAREGAAYIFFGQPELSTRASFSVTDADLTILADKSALTTSSGGLLKFSGIQSVRPAGDVNGDRLPDILITARRTRNQSGFIVGAAGVLYGRKQFSPNLNFSALDVILYGRRPGTLGHPAMDRGADLNGDGRADILINDPYYQEKIGGSTNYRGRLWVIRGQEKMPKLIDVEGAADLIFVPDTTIPGMFGYTWNTGDWNADGKPDIVIGDHYAGDKELHIHAGKTYMYYNGRSFSLSK